jgi:hypothetical protein
VDRKRGRQTAGNVQDKERKRERKNAKYSKTDKSQEMKNRERLCREKVIFALLLTGW